MDIQNAYNEWSEIYDSNTNLTRDLDQQVTRESLTSQRFKSILELGCGTGKNTIFLAAIGTQVHALDFSESMIVKARGKVKAENVRFEMMDLTKPWACETGTYDLVVCNLVLEHIQQLPHIFTEAARTLMPGGRFFINELHPFKQYRGTKAKFERGTDTIEVEAIVHHISDFTNTASASGFKLVKLNEYWHAKDQNKPPHLISLLFEKA